LSTDGTGLVERYTSHVKNVKTTLTFQEYSFPQNKFDRFLGVAIGSGGQGAKQGINSGGGGGGGGHEI
jgi:uncharacterized membrane protein